MTLSPGVDFWDIGEMQTVPYLLGIGHPTGFPLFVLGGFVFAHVLPFGNPAWRLSLLCAIASASAAYALFTLVRALCNDARIACATAFAFSIGAVVWVHAVRADAHDVALAFIAIALAAAAQAGTTRSPHALGVAAFALGCGVATHPVGILVLPSALVLGWPALVAANALARVRTLGLAALPMLAYAYVPLRSGYVEAHGLDPGTDLGLVGGAIFDTGAPGTPAAFWRYVTGSEFHAAGSLATGFSPAGLAHAAAFARDSAFREYGYVMLVFALVGFINLAATRPRIAIGLGLVPLGGAIFVANYAAESDVARYGLPGLWMIAACAGVGIAWLATAIFDGAPARVRTIAAFVLLAAMLPTVGFAAHEVGRTNRVNDARSLGPAIASHTVDGSLLVATWTYATPLFYEVYVARTLGTRRIASGWPHEFAGRYDAWHARFKHVYFVLPVSYDVTPFSTPIEREGGWQLSELRS